MIAVAVLVQALVVEDEVEKVVGVTVPELKEVPVLADVIDELKLVELFELVVELLPDDELTPVKVLDTNMLLDELLTDVVLWLDVPEIVDADEEELELALLAEVDIVDVVEELVSVKVFVPEVVEDVYTD